MVNEYLQDFSTYSLLRAPFLQKVVMIRAVTEKKNYRGGGENF